jgi:hypothetical protein
VKVKGLPSRKTLGQWLDERGVTAKPRITLADQVQQAHVMGSTRSRTHQQQAAVTAGGPPAQQQHSDLTSAAAHAAQLGNVMAATGAAGTTCGLLVRSTSWKHRRWACLGQTAVES